MKNSVELKPLLLQRFRLDSMSQLMLERRLRYVAEELKRLRAELALSYEQLASLEDDASEAGLRALVAETPMAEAEARATRRHADAMAKHRAMLERSMADSERERDALLDQLGVELAKG